jgi:translation elongation factor EF-G
VRLKQALKKIMLNQNDNNLCPVFFGTSIKNKGVQPLMDAII